MTKEDILEWYESRELIPPKTAREWQTSSIKSGKIPYTYNNLRKHNIKLAELINYLYDSMGLDRGVAYNPFTAKNSMERVGLRILDEVTANGHKRLTVECTECLEVSTLDYGTLGRMEKSSLKHCQPCRNAGGKPLSKERLELKYSKEGFEIVGYNDKVLSYKCCECNSVETRTLSHAVTSEYIVCSKCFPEALNRRVATNDGTFASKMEHLTFLKLREYFSEDEIKLQVKYDDLFSTGTKHTLDFYIPKVDLKLEVTTKSQRFDFDKYRETAIWKETFGVVFAYTLKEVDDIVRSYLKE